MTRPQPSPQNRLATPVLVAQPRGMPTPAEYAAMPWPARQRLARLLALGRDAERRAREKAERRRLGRDKARRARAARARAREAAPIAGRAEASRLLAAITPDDPAVIAARRVQLLEATHPRRTG